MCGYRDAVRSRVWRRKAWRVWGAWEGLGGCEVGELARFDEDLGRF